MGIRRKFIYLLQLPAIGLQLFIMAREFNEGFSENPWFIAAVLGVFFVILNSLFVRELYRFIKNEHNQREVFWELLFVFITGLSNIFIFATAYFFFGIKGDKGIVLHDFATSLYFSVVTWTTLGFGDFSPVPELRVTASLEALIGYTYMALLIGLFLSVVKIEIKDRG